MQTPKNIALIPARSGSKRLPDKNIRFLSGHPLIAYTISAALESNLFDDIIVSTDSHVYADIAKYYGAKVPFLRPKEISTDYSPDIEWVEHALTFFQKKGIHYDCFTILRPTSPFRTSETIRRASEDFFRESNVDSLRAVQKVSEHPGKMWIVNNRRMKPLLPQRERNGQPMHSRQYASLPQVYVQNASLEMAWTRVVFDIGNISGDTIIPFLTYDNEGFDINTLYDWKFAEYLIQTGKAILQSVKVTSFSGISGIKT